jgi:hypothetical protein
MTPEELILAAEMMLLPVVDRMVTFTFEAMPPERVERLVVVWMNVMRRAAVRSLRGRIAEARRH